jgi:Flp pilus assembly protein TadD
MSIALMLAVCGCNKAKSRSFSPPEPDYDGERLVLAPFGDASLARQQTEGPPSRKSNSAEDSNDSAAVVLPPADGGDVMTAPIPSRSILETDSSFTFTTDSTVANAARLAAIPRGPSTFDDLGQQRSALLEQAVADFQQGRLDEAMTAARQTIDQYPEDARAYELLGLCLVNKNELRKAISNFDTAIRLQPKHAPLYTHRGSTYLRMRYPARAEPDLTRAIELNPEDPVPYVWRSICHLNTGAFSEAIADADQALRYNDKIPDAYFVRCLSYLQTGRRDKARGDFDSAVKLGLDKASRDMVAPFFETK